MPHDRSRGRVAKLGLLLFLAAPSFPSQAADCVPTFPALTSLKAGINPFGVAVGDFNNDQKPDIAVANGSSEYPNGASGTVTVFLNDGNRTFHTAGSYPVQGRASSIAAGDLDGDGRVDLAVSSYGMGLAVFYGAGDGNFKPRVDMGDQYANYIVLGDFDGDQRPEALTAHDDGRLVVWKGFGEGIIPSRREYTNSGRPRSAQVGDFNGDGKLDFVASDFHNRRVVVMTGNGDATFEWKADIAIDTEGNFVTCGDVDGDSKIDIVAAGNGTNSFVLYGKGDATFENPVATLNIYPPAGIVIADFDNNGIPDLASAGVAEGNVALFTGKGARQFASPTNYTAGGMPSGLAVADFDNDGNKDIIVANQMPYQWQGAASILWGKGGRFDAPPHVDIGFEPGTLEVNDYNADGRPDLLSLDGLHFLSALSQADGSFQPGFGIAIGLQATGGQVTRDFDGDGSLDIAVPVMSIIRPPQPPPAPPPMPPTYGVTIFSRNSQQEFQPSGGITIFSQASAIIAGKFNGDALVDVAVMLPFENKLSVFLARGDRYFNGPATFSLVQPTWGTTADLDGDSQLDLIVVHQGGISTLKGSGTGSFAEPVLLTTNGWREVSTADFNADGRVDLVTISRNDKLAFWMNEGNGQLKPGAEYSLAGIGTKIVPADLNADGRLDVVVQNSDGVSVFIGNGDGTFRAHSHHPVGESPRSLVVADFTGDGRPDIGVVSGMLIRRLSLLENVCAAPESRLRFEKGDGKLWISWKSAEPGTLETAMALDPSHWETFPAPILIEGDQTKIEVNLGGSARYFRLRRVP